MIFKSFSMNKKDKIEWKKKTKKRKQFHITKMVLKGCDLMTKSLWSAQQVSSSSQYMHLS